MIEKTTASGFMARHLLHWAKPDNPTYDEFFDRVQNVDFTKKDDFLSKIRKMWSSLGRDRKDPQTVTQLVFKS